MAARKKTNYKKPPKERLPGAPPEKVLPDRKKEEERRLARKPIDIEEEE